MILDKYIQTYTLPSFLKLVLNRLGIHRLWKLGLRNKTVMYVRGSTQDSGTVSETWIDKTYLKWIKGISGTIIDIGANIGSFTVFAAKQKETKVFSFEPMPDNFRMLDKNVKANNLHNVQVFPTAVSGKKTKVKVFRGEKSGMHSMYGSGKEYETVQTTTIKEIMDHHNIKRCGFLKLDCEGAEYEILMSTPKGYLKRIKNIALEYHDVGTARRDELVEFLKKAGFTVRAKGNEKIGIMYASI
ncbi:FkbM family methyltransferase [Candidatus Woesearchaeota archaeon]|nr:FkbM family methyltransferase [Candidatus Woesearchaeota archaeon]